MRRRFIQVGLELVEVTDDYVAPSRSGGVSGDSALWNDRLYQDGGDPRFSSRTQHRNFMRENNLTTVDDYTDAWRKAEQRRMDFRKTGRDPSRKQDVINAVQKLWKP